MKKLLIAFLITVFFGANAFAKIRLPAVFSDNMVLQQNSDVAVWGWALPSEKVKIVCSWNSSDTITAVADNRSKWKTSVKTVSAGGPYTIEIIGSSYIKLNNVMLGEVWICSGQSNMEWWADRGLDNKEEAIAGANYPDIRFFHVQKIGADYPQQDCFASWEECTPETMRKTSAVGYFFGRELHKKLDVPVGLIVSAWGGTPAEVWIEKERIQDRPEYQDHLYKEVLAWWPGAPGIAYNAMIYPLAPYGIAGAIWYQGETKCKTYPIYASLKKDLIENWRSVFNKDFPFYFVQIAPWQYGKDVNSAYLREQQELVTKTVENTGMVVVSDLVTNVNDIHPKNKLDVGKRLAAFALAETYKKDVGEYKSPAYRSMKVEKHRIRLFFDNAAELKCTGKKPLKFLIAGDDKVFVEAKAKIDGNTIVVYSKKVKDPVAVRFCFDNTSLPDVFSTAGLPLAPFRTDRW